MIPAPFNINVNLKEFPEEMQDKATSLILEGGHEYDTIDNRVEYMCVTAVSQMMQVFQKEIPPSRTMFSGNIVEKQTTK